MGPTVAEKIPSGDLVMGMAPRWNSPVKETSVALGALRRKVTCLSGETSGEMARGARASGVSSMLFAAVVVVVFVVAVVLGRVAGGAARVVVASAKRSRVGSFMELLWVRAVDSLPHGH